MWTDITSECREGASALTDKMPLVFSEKFSLLEAMSAVELMDPKMDQCCGLTGPLDITLLVRTIFPEDFNLEYAVELIQSVIICETQLFAGFSTFETIYQCKLCWTESWPVVDKYDNISLQSVFSFSKDLVEASSRYSQIVLNTDIYEDEDFQPPSHPGIEFQPDKDFESASFLNFLGISDPVINFDSSLSKLKTLFQLRLQMSNLMKKVDAFATAQMKLGRVNKSSLNVVADIVDASVLDSGAADVAPNSNLEAANTLTEIMDITRVLLDHLNSQEIKNLPDIPPHVSNPHVSFAFDPAPSKSILTTPLRSITFPTFSKAIEYLQKMFSDLKNHCQHALTVLSSSSSCGYDTVLDLCGAISRNQGHLLARSLFWAALQCFRSDIPRLAERSMEIHRLPELLRRFELLQNWLRSIAKSLWDNLRLFMTFRMKLQPRIEQTLQRWNDLVDEARFVDERFYTAIHTVEGQESGGAGPVQQWVSYWTLTIVTTIMDTNFGVVLEGDLVPPVELDYFYFYWDYVLSNKLYVMKLLLELDHQCRVLLYQDSQSAVAEELRLLRGHGKGGNKKVKAKLSRKRAELEKLLEEPAPVLETAPGSVAELLVRGRCGITKALYRYYFILQLLGHHTKTENCYTSWPWRFANRFRALHGLSNPAPLDFEAFRELQRGLLDQSLGTILLAMDGALKTSKAMLDTAR